MSQVSQAIDEFMRDVRMNADENAREAAVHLAGVFKAVLPGSISRGVRVERRGDGRYEVMVPGKWVPNEFGYMHARGKRRIPPKPISRTAFARERDTIIDILKGE